MICFSMAGPAFAETVNCDLSGVPVNFEIDRGQFAPALGPNEPPKRKTTVVNMGGTSFDAEPMLMNGLRGFWVEKDGEPRMMMVIQDNGTAVLKEASTNTELSGSCEIIQ